MLTKHEKTILKYCNKKFKPDTDISSEKLSALVPQLSPFHFYQCCKELSDKEYVEDFTTYISGDFSFSLTYKGRHYKEISLLELKEFIFKSVIVPVVVSLLTTVILWLIS